MSFLCACLSVLSACTGDQPFHEPRRPGCPPRSLGPLEVPSLTARDPTGGLSLGCSGPARVPSAASRPHPPGKGDLQPQLDSALQDVNDMYLLLEETEKQAVRRALIEERGRFCTFITFLQPVVVGPVGTRSPSQHLHDGAS